ncbi:MAG: DNA repair protein RecN [Bacteroidales bacterium]|nr:DNA repair protein RecN [Bacteroidales bacterium]
MLKHLAIGNYALIDSLSISFDDGFSVITGETGAGKSILLGALGFVLGDRSDSSIMLDETKKCTVEATFVVDNERFKSFFEENDLDFEDELILRRELTPTKKTRAFINDTPVTVQQLKELGNQLVDIHSQHDSLLLTNADFQLKIVDDAADNNALLADYQRVYRNFVSLRNELKNLREMSQKNVAENDYLAFQLDEFVKADLQEGEYEEVSQKLELLENAEEVKTLLAQSLSTLSESEYSILDQLNDLKSKVDHLRRYLPQAEQYLERIDSTKIELKDIAQDLDNLQDSTQFDADSLNEIQERYDLIQRLMLKHHVQNYEDLLAIREELHQKMGAFENIDEEIAKKELQLKNCEKELTKLADDLSAKRKKVKISFEKAVTEILRQLKMPHAIFEIEISEFSNSSDNSKFTITGKDRVRFLFSANKGIAPDDMSRVASGGELSRLMLAIKAVASENAYIPTLIFDEIDTGVSGEVASKLGDIMQKMGESLQIISITHLPQIASKAKNHFFVYKDEDNEKTRSCIRQLSHDERVTEIAKMLSNDKITPEAIKAAERLMCC